MVLKEKRSLLLENLLDENESQTSLSLSLPKNLLSDEGKAKTNYLVHRAFQNQLKNERQGTKNTKTRAEVRGGGRKPWKQKGSGRARAGSNRSPLWKGGGVSFGPKPKDYNGKINRKEWRLALGLVLFKKQESIKVVKSLSPTSLKTKDFVHFLKSFELDLTKKILIIVSEEDPGLRRSSKNLKNIKILKANCLNLKEVLVSKTILLTKNSLKQLEETYYHD